MEQEMQPNYWWYAYGHFPVGIGNMPHAGRVIAFYRDLRGWDQDQFAAEMGLGKRRIYQIEESAVLKSSSRREVLVKLLNIPPALLGVMALQYLPDQAVALNPSTTEAYEGVLSLAWSAYYSSNAHESATTVALWLHHLEDSQQSVSGVARDQLQSLLCRFYQLSGVIARDRLDFQTALAHGGKAVQIAFALQNVELIASSLYRRARSYVELKRYDLAARDLERALPYAQRSRDPLRCYTSICLAETYSLLPPADTSRQREALLLLDEVGKTVRTAPKGVLEGDGSFVKVDIPGLYMIRGDVLRRFGRMDDAQDALLIVGDHLPKNFVRWRGNLLVAEATLSHAEGDIEGCCGLAQDALDLVEETHSTSTRKKIERLHAQLQIQAPASPAVGELGQRLAITQGGV